MKATRIPGTGSYNITLTLDEMEDLLDQTKPIQKGDETGYWFRALLHRTINERKELDSQLVVEKLDAQLAIMTEEKSSIDNIIEQASSMSLIEAMLFVAKELKIPAYIDTEEESFKICKDLWSDSDPSYRNECLRGMLEYGDEDTNSEDLFDLSKFPGYDPNDRVRFDSSKNPGGVAAAREAKELVEKVYKR